MAARVNGTDDLLIYFLVERISLILKLNDDIVAASQDLE